MDFPITSGIVTGKGQKVVIYGAEGVGKTSLASRFPNPVFTDTEGSTDGMDVRRLPKPSSWTMLRQEAEFVRDGGAQCSTWVIDTFDWAEKLCINELCAANNKKGIEDFGYGNGYVYEQEEIARFLTLLEDITLRGINVVITCHAATRKYELPEELGQYDRWELKLGKKTSSQISPIVKEWADIVLFLNYKTHVFATDDKGNKHKAAGKERVMYTSHHPCWDAKNRCGLPDELPLAWESISHVIPDNMKAAPVTAPPAVSTVPDTVKPPEKAPETSALDSFVDITPQPQSLEGIPKALADLMKMNNVTPEEIEYVCSEVKGYMPKGMPLKDYPNEFIQGCLVGAWAQVFGEVQANRTVPF